MLILWDHTLRHFARKFNRKQMANVVGPHTQRRQGSKPRNKALEPEFLEQTKWPPPLRSVTGSNGGGGCWPPEGATPVSVAQWMGWYLD